jgi:hypothetical protein
MKRAQLQILLHGLIVVLVGLLCGVPYGRAITHGWGEEAVRGWRLAHFSLVVGGMWLMVVAAVCDLLALRRREIGILVYSLVTSGYGFTVASVVGASAGVRGLEARGPMINILAFGSNLIASVGALVWAVIMIVGTVRALREVDGDTSPRSRRPT